MNSFTLGRTALLHSRSLNSLSSEGASLGSLSDNQRIRAASNFIALIPSRLIHQTWQTFLELNSKGLHQNSGKEKESCCLVFPSSTKREIRCFHVVVVQRRPKEMYQKARCTCKVVVLLIQNLHATSTFPTMHLICPNLPPPPPPQFCRTLFFISPGYYSRPKKKIGGGGGGANKVNMGNVEVAYCFFAVPVAVAAIVA